MSGGGMGGLFRRKRKRDDTSLSYWPDRPDETAIVYPRAPERPPATLPVPPEELRLGYAKYEESGARTVATMRRILKDAGSPIEEARRILDFGCAAGRVIRNLHDLAEGREIWGCDVSGAHVAWCKQNLVPPFHFLTGTLVPHLPFEDRRFDLVYAFSVFTHLEDMTEGWFLELYRILRPGGILYATIHDRHTIELLAGKYKDHPFAEKLRDLPEWEGLARSDFGMLSLRIPSNRVNAMQCNVYYETDYLRRRLEHLFGIASVVPEADSYQTTLVLRRR